VPSWPVEENAVALGLRGSDLPGEPWLVGGGEVGGEMGAATEASATGLSGWWG
jgi:hypothetical protein